MTTKNSLVEILKRTEYNKAISTLIKEKFDGVVGQAVDKIPQEQLAEMNSVVKSLCEVLEEQHTILISNNITANSPMDYAKFLIEAMKAYIDLPDYSHLSSLSNHEKESFVIAHINNMTIEGMRVALAENQFANQVGTNLSYELIIQQIELIEDSVIKESYKTLLHQTLNAELNA